jgi:hypothetical protein
VRGGISTGLTISSPSCAHAGPFLSGFEQARFARLSYRAQWLAVPDPSPSAMGPEPLTPIPLIPVNTSLQPTRGSPRVSVLNFNQLQAGYQPWVSSPGPLSLALSRWDKLSVSCRVKVPVGKEESRGSPVRVSHPPVSSLGSMAEPSIMVNKMV